MKIFSTGGWINQVLKFKSPFVHRNVNVQISEPELVLQKKVSYVNILGPTYYLWTKLYFPKCVILGH